MSAYCIPIHVPIFTDGSRNYVISEWARALHLLRDSFEGSFEKFILVAPARQASDVSLVLEPIGEDDGFDPRPSIPADGGRRAYWMQGDRRRWLRDVQAALAESDIAHTAINDLYKPVSRDALEMALRLPMTTVFFLDTDEVIKMRDMIASGILRKGPDRDLYLWYYERLLRRISASADLTFLKGQALYRRYAPYSRNPKTFQDTSYRSDEIVTVNTIESRIAVRGAETPLRLVYCGRLVARKGCDHAINIIARARALGADVTLDLIGHGDCRDALQAQVAKLGLEDVVRFLGELPYGADLITRLSGYDGLLFTPLSEDTPRMIFDGYAAGLPLLGYDIPYVRERSEEEQATVLLPFGQINQAAEKVAALAQDPTKIAELARRALQAAHENATDVWYRRRAEWTLEAHAQALRTGQFDK